MSLENTRHTLVSACFSEMGGYDRLDSKLKAPVAAIWKMLKSLPFAYVRFRGRAQVWHRVMSGLYGSQYRKLSFGWSPKHGIASPRCIP